MQRPVFQEHVQMIHLRIMYAVRSNDALPHDPQESAHFPSRLPQGLLLHMHSPRQLKQPSICRFKYRKMFLKEQK